MKKIMLFLNLLLFVSAGFAQTPSNQIGGREVYNGEDVVFREIDEHTWVGTGKLVSNESLYLLEGSDKALLIDAGTKIKDLDKIVASITSKPVMLVATHVHPDHTGSAINDFPELYINAADTVNIPQMMPDYKGELKFLSDGEIIDLGGRKVEVIFTPGHTPGSTTFIDKKAGYGFSGDSFGSGNLLLTTDFSTLAKTSKKTSAIMDKYRITKFYPGHYFGMNEETKRRVDDLLTISEEVLAGKEKGTENPQGMLGLNLLVNKFGVRVNYNETAIH
ncbi:MAG TPA: MBL fold metallo-hydrolase [Draconibacterium sp.]|nr:MBL fold metallo-hydrolase [Draconibacterium sp.]